MIQKLNSIGYNVNLKKVKHEKGRIRVLIKKVLKKIQMIEIQVI